MENILVPRNIEGRKVKLKQMNIKLLSQEVIDGDLYLDESFMDIDAKFIKIKKVNGYIKMEGGQWTEIPAWLNDVEIKGSFNCSNNKLETMKNCPQKIGGILTCSFNKLTSLEGCPKILKGSFYCRYNKLVSLEGCPENIKWDFDCRNNKVKMKLLDYVKLKGLFLNKI